MKLSPAWNRDQVHVAPVDLSPILTPRYTVRVRVNGRDQYYWRLPGNIRYELFIPLPDTQSRVLPGYTDFLIQVINGLSGLEKQVSGAWGMVFVKKGEERNVHIYVWVDLISDAEKIKSFFHSIYSSFLAEYGSSFDIFFRELRMEDVLRGYPYIPIYVDGTRSYFHLSNFRLALSEKLPLISNAEYQGIELKKGLIMENLLLNMARVNDPGIVAIFTMSFRGGHIRLFGDRHYEAKLKSADLSSMYMTSRGELQKATNSSVTSLLHRNYMEKIDSPYHFIVRFSYATIARDEKTIIRHPHEPIFSSINGFFTQMGNFFKHWTYLERGGLLRNRYEDLIAFFSQTVERKTVGGDSVLSPKELSYFFIYPTMDLFYHGMLINVAGSRQGPQPAVPEADAGAPETSVPVPGPVMEGGEVIESAPSPSPQPLEGEQAQIPTTSGSEPRASPSPPVPSRSALTPSGSQRVHEVPGPQVMPEREVKTIVLTPPDSPSSLVYTIKSGSPVHGIAIGSTGSGKSSELISIFLQLIKDRNSAVFYLDPFGRDIMDSIIPNLTEEELKRVVLIDPDDPDLIVGMNIMAPQELALVQDGAKRQELEERIKSQTSYQGTVLQKIGDDLYETFRYITESTSGTGTAYTGARILTNLTKGIKVVGMWKNSNLVDLSYLFTFKNSRQKLKAMVPSTDLTTHGFIELLNQYKPDDLHSTIRLIDSIVDSEPLRRILCTRNFRASMLRFINERKIVLITAGANTTQNSMRILLSAMISMIYVAGTSPERDPKTSVYIFADEFQEYANSSMKLILDIGRKWGISLFLATTSFSGIKNNQLKSSILANAQIRMLFRLGDDDLKFFKQESQLIAQNGGSLPPFRMIAKTPDLKYGIYNSFRLPSKPRGDPARAMEIIRENTRPYVVPDDTRESPLFDPNDLFVEIAMVIYHAEGRYIVTNGIRESDPEYLNKAFATLRDMGTVWSALAQAFPDTYSPVDNRTLYSKLVQGIQRGIYTQLEFAGGGKESAYAVTPKGELLIMQWLGGASAGGDMHRMLVLRSIKYLVRKRFLVRLVKQAGFASSDLEAVLPPGTYMSEADRKLFGGRERVLVEVETTPANVGKKIQRALNSNALVLFVVAGEDGAREIFREILRFRENEYRGDPGELDSYYMVLKLDVDNVRGEILTFDPATGNVQGTTAGVYLATDRRNISGQVSGEPALGEPGETAGPGAVPGPAVPAPGPAGGSVPSGPPEPADTEGEPEQEAQAPPPAGPPPFEEAFLYILKNIPYAGRKDFVRFVKSFRPVAEHYAGVYDMPGSMKSIDSQLRSVVDKYLKSGYMLYVRRKFKYSQSRERIFMISPTLYFIRTGDYPELLRGIDFLSGIYINMSMEEAMELAKDADESDLGFISTVEGTIPADVNKEEVSEFRRDAEEGMREAVAGNGTGNGAVTGDVSGGSEDAPAPPGPPAPPPPGVAGNGGETVPAHPSSLWSVLPDAVRGKVRAYLDGRKGGEAVLRAFRELGYRDFFGFCLGLLACYQEREPTEPCGRLVLSRYRKNTGDGEIRADPRFRDPMPSFDFARKVLGQDYCIDGEFIETIDGLVSLISSDLCALGDRYCFEANNFNTLKNMRRKVLYMDGEGGGVIFY
ncbi:MAG: hypothetical protein ACP5QH_00010 [Thermoplasmata archaeon]